MNNNNSKQYVNDEIDLRKIFKLFKERSRFILSFTGVITLITIVYVLFSTTPPTQYKFEISFLKPSAISVINLNDDGLLNESDDSIFSVFLTNISSKSLQKEVFINGGYAEKLSKGGKSIVDEDINQFVKKISLNIATKKNKAIKIKLPYVLSIKGLNPDILSEFLDNTVNQANQKTVDYFVSVKKLKIKNRLNAITLERKLLLARAKKERLSRIKIIQDKDNQKESELYQKILRAKFKEKTQRLNQIVTLTDAYELATTLGVSENNILERSALSLKVPFETGDNNIKLIDSENVPEWYLYGEKALFEMIKSLQKRENDEPFIPEIITFKNQLSEIENNTLLQSLLMRLDDTPYISEINELDIETLKLESFNVDSTDWNSMQLYQPSSGEEILLSNKKPLIIMLALIGSFLLSICLIFLMNVFKDEEVTNIQKGR